MDDRELIVRMCKAFNNSELIGELQEDPLKFCDEHTASAKEIGAAIGCYIVTEPLPPDAKEKEPKQ